MNHDATKKRRNRCANALIWFKNRIRFSKPRGKIAAECVSINYCIFFPLKHSEKPYSGKNNRDGLIFLMSKCQCKKITTFLKRV